MSLLSIHSNLKKYDAYKIALEVLEELEDYMLELNNEQIEKKGITSFGGKMTPSYAESTKKKKKSKSGIGGITGHVTLHHNEGLAKEIEVIYNDKSLFFATDISVNGFELDQFFINKYGEWRGLTDNSIEKLQKKFNPLFIKRSNEAIFG